MNWRRYAIWAGVGVIAASLLLPESLYAPLPQRDTTAVPPISGFLLVRLALIVDGVLLLWYASRERVTAPIPSTDRIDVPGPPAGESGSARRYGWAVAAVTLLALALRLLRLDSDLWLDEIQALMDYRDVTPWQVLTSYVASNNHLLNTLLVKLSVGMFGEHEWAVRVPAALFGAATVPLMYWVSRQAMSRRGSLAAACLLAVSYHHIFFSQNARAYSAYIFFSLAASGLLVRCLQRDRARDWTLYIAVTLLNVASIVISVFVIAAHVAVSMAALIQIRRQGGSPAPLLRRLATVFPIIGLLSFHVYAATLPQMYVYMHTIYAVSSAQFSVYARQFVSDLVRGLTEGFGTSLLLGAVPFLAVAAAGYVSVARRNWPLILALTLPGALQAVVLVVRQLTLAPRLFLLALPLAILVAVQALEDIGRYAASRRGAAMRLAAWTPVVGTILLAALFIAPLPRYYSTPKQDYRRSLAYLAAARRPGDTVVVLHLAETGVRYYGGEVGLREGEDCFYVRSVAALDEVLARHPANRTWLIGTFPRELHNLAELKARVDRDWEIARQFPGTIGDGVVVVWRPRGLRIEAR